MTNAAFPWRFDAAGRTAVADLDAHILQMIELLLFTEAGERVMRPDFGGGVRRLVFGAASPEVASALQFVIQAGRERWLGDIVQVEKLSIEAADAALRVELSYLVLSTGEQRTATFERVVA
jgi:uncharacterized protein